MFVVEELIPETGLSGSGRILGSRVVRILWGSPEGDGELGAWGRLVQGRIHGLENGRTSRSGLGIVAEVGGFGGLDAAEDIVGIDWHVRVDSVLSFSVFWCRVKT